MLYSAVYSTLSKADQLKCKSVSIPAISSGLFGFSKPLCVKVFYQAIKQFVVDTKQSETELDLKLVRLTNFDSVTTELF